MESMLTSLKKAAGALRDSGIPYAVAGSLAAWARGGPPSDHDVDLLIRPADAERALSVLEGQGMEPGRPPEGWLVKAKDGDVTIDLIFRPSGYEVDDEVLARAEEISVHAMPMPVVSLEDVLVSQLLSLTEQELEYQDLLERARAVREQVDWDDVRQRTADSPFARAFFTMADGLSITS